MEELKDSDMLRDVNGIRRLLVREHQNVTIIFADIAGFTAFSATVTPQFLVRAASLGSERKVIDAKLTLRIPERARSSA